MPPNVDSRTRGSYPDTSPGGCPPSSAFNRASDRRNLHRNFRISIRTWQLSTNPRCFDPWRDAVFAEQNQAVRDLQTARNTRTRSEVASISARIELERFATPAYSWSRGGKNFLKIPRETGVTWWTQERGQERKTLLNRRRKRRRERSLKKSVGNTSSRSVPSQAPRRKKAL